jgi:uncharacterized membrane protein
MLDILNMEMIIVEFLRALVGSFGMLLAIPLTAVVCGWLYSQKDYDEEFDEIVAEFLKENEKSKN